MAQSEFKEYIHINLAMVLPHVEQNDDLVQNKKMLPNGLVFYYMYLSEMNDEDKIKEAIETLLQEEDSLTLETVTKRLDKIDPPAPSLRRRKPSSPFCGGNVPCLLTALTMCTFCPPEKEKKEA